MTQLVAPSAALPTRVLVVGLPRSGTTWLENCLGRASGVRRVHEPDNERRNPFALRAKRGLPRFPVLCPGDQAGDYERLWAGVFAGAKPPRTPPARLAHRLHRSVIRSYHGRFTSAAAESDVRLRLAVRLARPLRPDGSRSVVAKSVLACLCLDWIAANWAPEIVVIVRHPLNCVSSWWRLQWAPPFDGDVHMRRAWPRALAALPAELQALPTEPPSQRPLARTAWQVGALLTAMHASLRRHPEWRVVRHENLTADPDAVRRLAEALGLRWTPEAERYLQASNRPGQGAYEIAREHARERVRWQERLSRSEVDDVLDVLGQFPNADWMLGVGP